jgi:hypothetical protein
MQSRVDRQIRALALAQQCAAHGARVRTISRITGMNPRDLLRLLFPERQSVPRGRAPDSPEWYHGANLLYRAEASIVMSIYRRLRTADFSGGEALLGAYRQYVGVCQSPHRISFDRAFDLAAHTDGLWLTESRSFSLVVCPTCHSEFLAALRFGRDVERPVSILQAGAALWHRPARAVVVSGASAGQSFADPAGYVDPAAGQRPPEHPVTRVWVKTVPISAGQHAPVSDPRLPFAAPT